MVVTVDAVLHVVVSIPVVVVLDRGLAAVGRPGAVAVAAVVVAFASVVLARRVLASAAARRGARSSTGGAVAAAARRRPAPRSLAAGVEAPGGRWRCTRPLVGDLVR